MDIFGELQPELPSPAAIFSEMCKIVLHLKDCFSSIPLHPDDSPRFAFSLPAINYKEPIHRFQWKVLPKGMANSHIVGRQMWRSQMWRSSPVQQGERFTAERTDAEHRGRRKGVYSTAVTKFIHPC